jgi:subtilase family serine protease
LFTSFGGRRPHGLNDYSATTTGNGQNIVVAGISKILLSDVQAFRTKYGLPAKDPQFILPPGAKDPGLNDAQFEGSLDVEWSGAIARNANIIYV